MTHKLLPKPVVGTDDTSIGDATQLKWEPNEDLDRCFVSFPFDQ